MRLENPCGRVRVPCRLVTGVAPRYWRLTTRGSSWLPGRGEEAEPALPQLAPSTRNDDEEGAEPPTLKTRFCVTVWELPYPSTYLVVKVSVTVDPLSDEGTKSCTDSDAFAPGASEATVGGWPRTVAEVGPATLVATCPEAPLPALETVKGTVSVCPAAMLVAVDDTLRSASP